MRSKFGDFKTSICQKGKKIKIHFVKGFNSSLNPTEHPF
jgi:hypothetical protein